MKGKQIKSIIKEAINSLKRKQLNEQGVANVPITGTCSPNIFATLDSWDQVFEATGTEPYGNQNQGHTNALMQFFNGNAVWGGAPEGATVKVNKDLFEMLIVSFPPENRVNDFLSDGQQGTWPVIEPQLHQINNSYDNVQYIYLTNSGGLAGNTLYPGVIYCMYDNAMMFAISNAFDSPDVTTDDPTGPPPDTLGTAPTTPTGMVTGMPGGKPEPPNKGPISPSQAGGMAMKPPMPKRRMMREQVERMKKLANIKNKK